MIKILTGKVPFEQYKHDFQLMRAFDVGNAILFRPNPLPRISYANEIWSLAQMCLNYDPEERPTADEALETILSLNVVDNRPRTRPADLNMPARRSTIDYDTLVSIVERLRMSFTR
jgi:serine/threonine protein kinase